MADSIPSPWIYDYLIDIAETHGGDLASVPPRPKSARAQIVKFVTHQKTIDDDTFVWAILSDKVHTILVRFSKEALGTYAQNPMSKRRPVSDHRTALIMIKHFCPFFARVPLGDGKGMSTSCHLVLDIGSFDLKGAYGEGIWGDPRDIETNETICEWVLGLRQDGGSGNILKLRKADREKATETLNSGRESTMVQPSLNLRSKPLTPKEVQKVNSSREVPAYASEPQRILSKAVSRRDWVKFWRKHEKLRLIPPEATTTLLKMEDKIHPRFTVASEVSRVKTSRPETRFAEPHLPESSVDPDRSPQAAVISEIVPSTPLRLSSREIPPATPSQWSPSVIGSPMLFASDNVTSNDVRLSPQQDSKSGEEIYDKDAEDLRLPSGSPSVLSDTRQTSPGLQLSSPVSSLPRPLSPRLQSSSITVSTSGPLTHEAHLARRVPIPRCSRRDADTVKDTAGYGTILVPDSDTSGVASQSQGPHSQSLSYGSQKSATRIQQDLQHPAPSQTLENGNSESQSPRRSLQSLSYASNSQSQGTSQSQSLSHGQSQLRNEVIPDHKPIHTLSSDDAVPVTEAVEERQSSDQDDAPDHMEAVTPSPTASHANVDSETDDDDEEDTDEEIVVEEAHVEPSTSKNEDQSQPGPQLDADDAKTKAMVDSYISQGTRALEASDSVATRLIFEDPLESKGQSIEQATSGPDRPLPPSSPDVFMSEDSFNASTSRRGSSPPPSPPAKRSTPVPTTRSHESQLASQDSQRGDAKRAQSGSSSQNMPAAARKTATTLRYHDPKVWEEPSFIRDRASPGKDLKGKAKAVNKARPRISSKRPIICISSSPEERPAKKRRVLEKPVAVVEVPEPVTSSRPRTLPTIGNKLTGEPPEHKPTVAVHSGSRARSIGPAVTKQEGASTHNGSPVSNAVSLADPDVLSEPYLDLKSNKPQRRKSTAVVNTIKKKEEPFESSSSSKPPSGAVQPRSGTSLHRTSNSVPSTTKTLRSSGLISGSFQDSGTEAGSSARGDMYSQEAIGTIPARTSSSLDATDNRPWLGGYKTRAYIPPDDGGPMLTGNDALQILLRTGRKRHADILALRRRAAGELEIKKEK